MFLEGGAGVGKSSLAHIYAKRGFQVHFEKFVELSQNFPRYDPGGIVLSFKWAALMVERMESLSALFGDRGPDATQQERIVFFDRLLWCGVCGVVVVMHILHAHD